MAHSRILANAFILLLGFIAVPSVMAQDFNPSAAPTTSSSNGFLQPSQTPAAQSTTAQPAATQQTANQSLGEFSGSPLRPMIPDANATAQSAPAQIGPAQLSNSGAAPQGMQNSASTQPAGNESVQTETPGVQTFQLSGRFHLVEGTNQGYLILRAEIPEGSYIYSMTNNEGPPPSEITVAPGNSFQIGGQFESDRHPKVTECDEVFQCRLEKHYQLVQFFVPIEIAAGVDPGSIRPELTFEGQICSDEGFCMPLRDKKVAADFAGYFRQEARADSNEAETKRQ